MLRLPDSFLQEMKELLGEEFEDFLQSYEYIPNAGLRINRMKLNHETWQSIAPFDYGKVEWIDNGYTYDKTLAPAKDPYYYAGLYYLQEPSAMTPANRLNVKPGDRVLDLCAAPGGKATELGAKLGGEGLLVANDISASRAKALLKNIELAGIANGVVTTELPQRLAEFWPCYFDKILVDAPCSGEGMFRKEPSMVASWEKNGSQTYVPIQREILKCAVQMLKPGGQLLFSTCTFSVSENEENVEWLLAQFPELSLIPLTGYAGFSGGVTKNTANCVRIWPHHMAGEGHFLALFQKSSDAPYRQAEATVPQSAEVLSKRKGRRGSNKKETSLSLEHVLKETDVELFLEKCSLPFDHSRLHLVRDVLYYLPKQFTLPQGLRMLRSGLLLGILKNGRFTPSQALAMALKKEQFADCIDFAREDLRVRKYLKGETVELDTKKSGWQLICVDGYPLGWGKASGDVLKNKYAAGWRMQS